MADEKIVRVVRVLEYVGPRDWIVDTLRHSTVLPTLSGALQSNMKPRGEITEVYNSSPRLMAEIRDPLEKPVLD